jgi:integrase
MASLRVRPRKGRPPTYCVRWRDPDQGGKETSLSWDDEEDATNFKRILEGNGHRYAPTAAMWKATKSKSPTIATILAEHIQGLPAVTARGRADYERDARLHITPHLGTVPVDSLTVATVQHWLRTLAATTMSDKTIANMHGLLSSAVDTARKAGHRPDNPCHGLRMPRRSEHSAVEMVFLTHGQWAALDTELGQVCDGYYQLLFRALAGTGARWGEAAALQVGDLTFTSTPPTVRIARALRRDENSRPYIGPTKTPRSRRTISLPEKLAAELAASAKGRPPADRVFNGHTGAPLHHSNIRLRAWLPAVNAAMNANTHGQHALTVVPRIHDLRHSHASWLFEAGVDILTVQRRLGHESITTTADRYGHLMPGQQIAAAAALNGVFG